MLGLANGSPRVADTRSALVVDDAVNFVHSRTHSGGFSFAAPICAAVNCTVYPGAAPFFLCCCGRKVRKYGKYRFGIKDLVVVALNG